MSMRRKKSFSRWMLAGLLVLAFGFMLLPSEGSLSLRSRLLSALRPALALFQRSDATPQVAAHNAGAKPDQTAQPTAPSAVDRQLRAEAARLFDENQRLRAQLHAATPAQGARMPKGITASIIAREVLWEQTVFGVDRGTLDGVTVGAGVLYQGVAVGRVVATAPRASCFAPLSHPQTRVAVRLTLCRAEGLLQGGVTVEGKPGCLLKIVAADLSARVGEWVVTSGLDGGFPAGCWVGEVASVERRGNLEWAVLVRPACDVSGIEAAYLLTEPPVQMPHPTAVQKK
jgi:rod shape-determining protein MreC